MRTTTALPTRPYDVGADLADPDLYASGKPHALWKRLREQSPVAWNDERDGPGFWAVTTYDLAVEVYRRSDLFSSSSGIVLRPDRWGPDPAGGKMLALTDAPRHGKLRALVNRAFAPRMIARLHDEMTTASRELIASVLERGRCEFVDEVASRLPVAMSCALTGVPRADWALMYDLTRRAFGADDPAFRTGSSSRASAAQAHNEIMLYYAALAAERRRHPGDDVVSALATGTVDGELLSLKEILLHCDNIIVAGQETARHATAGGVLALIDWPGEWRRLREDPALLDLAVEELLRWTSPGMHVMRVAASATELGGVRIEPGDAVVIWTPSANRDEATFEDPDRFDVSRRPNRHLALGLGAHYCLGASLARMELKALLGAFVRAVGSARLAAPVRRLRSNLIGGYTSILLDMEPM